MSAHDMTLSSSCTGCGAKSRGTFTHAPKSTSAFVAPICDCGHFVVLRTATTEKKCRKKILGLSQVQGKFNSIRFHAKLTMVILIFSLFNFILFFKTDYKWHCSRL